MTGDLTGKSGKLDKNVKVFIFYQLGMSDSFCFAVPVLLSFY